MFCIIYGYIRVSTKGQARDGNSLQVQESQVKQAGAAKIFQDSFTGTKLHRPALDELLSSLTEGDEVIVTKLDRIARNARDGIDIIDMILGKGCSIRILNMGTFDSSPSGKLTRTIFLAFAEFERDMIVERTQSGKEIARQSPDFREGRPNKYTEPQLMHAMELLESKSYNEVAKVTGISKSTLVRTVRKVSKGGNS